MKSNILLTRWAITILLGVCSYTSIAEEHTGNLLKEFRIYLKSKTTIIQPDKVIECSNDNNKVVSGVFQQVYLKQKKAKPIFFSATSKAVNVSGRMDVNYAIYLDICFNDGTKKYAVFKAFKVKSHDWETVKGSFTPEKPIRWIKLYLLFRKHTGKVYFKDSILREEK